MVSNVELRARIKDHFRFTKQEVSGLVIATLVTAFIFSFRNWGDDTFSLIAGVKSIVVMAIVVSLSFLFRLSCQKIYGLTEGYRADYKVWWGGLGIALLLCFLTFGKVPLVLFGGMMAAFLVKHRLGEFRYGFSYWHNAMIAMWGILGNMIAAILFAIGAFFFPLSFFFTKGLTFNLIMAFCSLLPLPQLDGLHLFFGSRGLYILIIATVLLGTVLLLSGTKIGLIAAIVIGSLAGILYIIIGSEK